MFKKTIILLFTLVLVLSFTNFAQDEMLYYEQYYPGHLRRVNERIREEIIVYLQSKVSDFNICEDLSNKLENYAESSDNYDAIEPLEFIKDIDLKFSRVWALKGKVFSEAQISEKLGIHSELFTALNRTQNVMSAVAMTGDLEKGFNFILIFYTP